MRQTGTVSETKAVSGEKRLLAQFCVWTVLLGVLLGLASTLLVEYEISIGFATAAEE